MGNFEFDGEKYKRASKHQKEWGNKLIAELDLQGNEVILDFGCGDGVLTEQLSMLVPDGKVLGIDSSVGMIKTAKKYKKFNLQFECMDINNIDFTDYFDVIFSNAALHWIKNHQKLLDNSYRALKMGGIIKWNFAGDGNCSNFYDVMKQIMQDKLYKEYFIDFEWPWFMPSKNYYENLLANTDFSEFKVDCENADRYFRNKDEMIKWIDQPSIVPFIKQIPEEKKEEFRSTVICSSRVDFLTTALRYLEISTGHSIPNSL